MSDLLETINTDNTIDNIEKLDDIDAEIDKVLAMKPIKTKQIRKPLSEEAKQKKRETLAKARQIRNDNLGKKVETEKQFKEKVQIIENLDEIIEKKIKEKIPVKIIKPVKDKSFKIQQKKELIESIVDDKLKGFKKTKQPESDFKLIQRFF